MQTLHNPAQDTKQAPAADDRDRVCPGCDTSIPGEWDAALGLYFCHCCSTTWRGRGRVVLRFGR